MQPPTTTVGNGGGSRGTGCAAGGTSSNTTGLVGPAGIWCAGVSETERNAPSSTEIDLPEVCIQVLVSAPVVATSRAYVQFS